jgi:hypothetical protein
VALERRFAAAFIDNDTKHRILGRRLKPFSLWHRHLLDAIHSPFLYGDELRFWDMREAVGICSLSFPHSKVRRPWIIPFLCFFVLGFPRSQWTRFLKRTRDKLLDYFGDYISRPEYTIKGPEVPPGPVLGPIPEGFIVVCDVISFLKCSEKEAWDLPVARAYWYQMGSYRAQKEQIDFMTEDERKFQADVKAAQERKTA